jgi:DNA polymerase III delta prime subunit
MTLRGVKPETIKKRLKVLFYGEAGVGKTTAAIQFPKPYLIDTEKGAENEQYVTILKKSGGLVFQTSDFDELLTEVKTLLTLKHEFKTLIIDPFTVVYQDLCDKWAAKLAKQSKDSDGTEFQRHRDKADMQVKHLIRLLFRLDMNVIITSHAKVKWVKHGKELVSEGNTFDCFKKADHIFDAVFEIQKMGKERYAFVKKTRIESFPDGEKFLFSYDEIANRYGKELLEKSATSETFATKEQVNEINRLIELLKIPEETYQKWLDKSNSEKFEEMPTDSIQKCIDHLKSKIQGEAAA